MAKKSKNKDKGTTPISLNGKTLLPIQGEVLEVRGAPCPFDHSGTTCRSFRALVRRGGKLIMHWWNGYQADGGPIYTGGGHSHDTSCTEVESEAKFDEACANASQTLGLLSPEDYPPQIDMSNVDEAEVEEVEVVDEGYEID